MELGEPVKGLKAVYALLVRAGAKKSPYKQISRKTPELS